MSPEEVDKFVQFYNTFSKMKKRLEEYREHFKKGRCWFL